LGTTWEDMWGIEKPCEKKHVRKHVRKRENSSDHIQMIIRLKKNNYRRNSPGICRTNKIMRGSYTEVSHLIAHPSWHHD
jgi:hypothetical protein